MKWLRNVPVRPGGPAEGTLIFSNEAQTCISAKQNRANTLCAQGVERQRNMAEREKKSHMTDRHAYLNEGGV